MISDETEHTLKDNIISDLVRSNYTIEDIDLIHKFLDYHDTLKRAHSQKVGKMHFIRK